MPALASTDVTYTQESAVYERGRGYRRTFKLAFGDGAKTYPSGGIPVDVQKLACPNALFSCSLFDEGQGGIAWTFDSSNKKLRGYYSGGGGTEPATPAAPIVSSGASSATAVDATTPTIK